jgi:peptidoglycan/LPS O-acetylase OafA/YrhL
MGIGIIMIIFATNDLNAPALATPLIWGFLGAGTLLLFGTRFRDATRKGLAAGAFLLGLLLEFAVLSGALPYTPSDATLFWPGLLIFGYVALLMVYLPVRNLLLGREPEEMPGVGIED